MGAPESETEQRRYGVHKPGAVLRSVHWIILDTVQYRDDNTEYTNPGAVLR